MKAQHSLTRVVMVAAAAMAALALLGAGVALATATPEQECQAWKNKAAGKYAACRQKAEAKLASTGDTAKYASAMTKCEAKFQEKWQKGQDKAGMAAATCPDAPLTEAQFETVIDEHSANISTALGGGGLHDHVAELDTCNSSLSTCNAGLNACNADLPECLAGGVGCTDDLALCLAGGLPAARVLSTGQTTCYDVNGTAIACPGSGHDGELQKGLARSYTDNDDGTITDEQTGLMWEKKSYDGSVHDVGNAYAWHDAFSVFIAALNNRCADEATDCTAGGDAACTGIGNGKCGFAGYRDWRLPNVNEL